MSVIEGIQIRGSVEGRAGEILSPEALELVARLQREFNGTRVELLDQRHRRQTALDAGESLDFLAQTKDVREGDSHLAPVPAHLQDPQGRDHRPRTAR